jgi:hypothetical protein
VPQRVRSLLASHVQTLEHLEVLALLCRDPERWWSAEGVAEELGISAGSAGARLEDLSSRMLLDARVAEAVMFRYNPVTDALRSSADDLARLYSDRPLQVIALVNALATAAIRGFADAFRIRPRKSDG